MLHQAAWGSVPSIEMPLLYEDINVVGTLNMMEAARQNKVKKFIYAQAHQSMVMSLIYQKQKERRQFVISIRLNKKQMKSTENFIKDFLV